MEKILIAIPTMDSVPVAFAHSLACLIRPASSKITMFSNALVYDARNRLAEEAVAEGFERVLWLDSDMVFSKDLLLRLNKDLDDGRDFVTALYFRRLLPTYPCIYQEGPCGGFQFYREYPQNDIFEIKGCGFGACLMRTKILQDLMQGDDPPFWPDGAGEDLSFCTRAKEAGYKILCDSRIKVGHCGTLIYGEQHYSPGMVTIPDDNTEEVKE